MRNQVLLTELDYSLFLYLRPPWVSVLGLQFRHVFLYQHEYPLGISQKLFQIGDSLYQLSILVEYLLPLQVSQTTQRHIKNSLCLHLR